MATTGVIDGGAMWLFVNGSLVASSTSHTFNETMATRDVTNKDSGKYTQKLGGLITWEASCDALYALDDAFTFSDLHTLMQARTAVTLLMARTYDGSSPGTIDQSSDTYLSGSALITGLDINSAGNGENVTYSVSFEGTGEPEELIIT